VWTSSSFAKENVMIRFVACLLLGAFAFAMVGCEAHSHAGNGSAGVEIDKK
jgi:hypothetical protein